MRPAERIPTEAECRDLIRDFGMFPNVVMHSKQVMRISLSLYDALIDKKLLNRELLTAGALLHDIAKSRTIKTGERRHDILGAEILENLGFLSVARIVASHVFFEGFDPAGKLEEREIVYYADKRVKHHRIVTLEERIDDLVKRYGINRKITQLIVENKKFVESLAGKIEKYLATDIESIMNRLKE